MPTGAFARAGALAHGSRAQPFTGRFLLHAATTGGFPFSPLKANKQPAILRLRSCELFGSLNRFLRSCEKSAAQPVPPPALSPMGLWPTYRDENPQRSWGG